MTAYVQEVYRYDWKPLALSEEQLLEVVRVRVASSMPEFLRSKSKRDVRGKAGVFEPGDLPLG